MTKLNINNKKYIKIDYSNSKDVEEPYVYLLELDQDGVQEREIALDSKGKIIHKIDVDSKEGNLRWEFNRFTEDEVKKNIISANEFLRYWDN